jgi:hypothetical protein
VRAIFIPVSFHLAIQQTVQFQTSNFPECLQSLFALSYHRGIGFEMEDSLQTILDSLPPKPSRSKLEPHREFIRELRRRGRSYQEIAQILRDHCGVTVAVHSVYNFVRVREKTEKRMRTPRHSPGRSAEVATSPGPAKTVYPHPPARS